jgi:hypothetical protein
VPKHSQPNQSAPPKSQWGLIDPHYAGPYSAPDVNPPTCSRRFTDERRQVTQLTLSVSRCVEPASCNNRAASRRWPVDSQLRLSTDCALKLDFRDQRGTGDVQQSCNVSLLKDQS